VKPRSYTQAIAQILQPLGYMRQDNDWILQVGDIEECVNLQRSALGRGVTVNLYSVDLRSQAMLNEALAPAQEWRRWWIDERISSLFSEFDTWWKNDPDGPADVAEKIRQYGLPFLIRMRDPLEQANRFGLQVLLQGKWRQGPTVAHLAITLHRMGEYDLACRALDVPRRRHEIDSLVDKIRAVRKYLDCPPTVNWPADGSKGPIPPSG
jgi:hypothetical protein